jgi:hypothetical protein
MNSLKDRITKVLTQVDYDDALLTEKIGMTIPDLISRLDSSNVELRTLETLSKELRIPLYSFFRNTDTDGLNPIEIPFYENGFDESEVQKLIDENLKLHHEISELKQLLELCKNNINSKTLSV